MRKENENNVIVVFQNIHLLVPAAVSWNFMGDIMMAADCSAAYFRNPVLTSYILYQAASAAAASPKYMKPPLFKKVAVLNICCIVKLPHETSHIYTKTSMLSLPWIFKLNNIFYLFPRPPLESTFLSLIKLHSFKEVPSWTISKFTGRCFLRGLTDHTVKSYSAYIHSYLDYLQTVLCKQPEDVSWEELREYIRWLQKKRSLSDRTT